MAGNKISMLGIVSSTPEQFWRYAPRIALPNSRRPHSTPAFCQNWRALTTRSHFESSFVVVRRDRGYFEKTIELVIGISWRGPLYLIWI